MANGNLTVTAETNSWLVLDANNNQDYFWFSEEEGEPNTGDMTLRYRLWFSVPKEKVDDFAKTLDASFGFYHIFIEDYGFLNSEC